MSDEQAASELSQTFRRLASTMSNGEWQEVSVRGGEEEGIAHSASPERCVGSRLISTSRAPFCLPSKGREAAGSTSAEVPTIRNSSAEPAAIAARLQAASGKASPNQTTPGLIREEQSHRGGNGSKGTELSCRSAPHCVQRSRQISPCRRITLREPARSCRPSTFCVSRVNGSACSPVRSLFRSPANRCSNSARAKWAAFGWARPMISLLHAYHSQTIIGSRAKASGVASSSGRYCFHTPPAPRNVGTPLS